MLKILPLLLLLPLTANASLSLPPSIPVPPPVNQAQFSRGIPLAEFTRLILEDILKKPFVLSPELLSATQLVGLSHSKLTAKSAESILRQVLDAQNFELRAGDVYYVLPKKPVDKAGRIHFSYKPFCRPVSYFASALPAVFPDTQFSFKSASSDAPGSDKLAGLDYFFAYIDPSQQHNLSTVIASLDKPVPQVSVHAMLLEVSTDERSGSGVRLSATLLNDKLSLSFGSLSQNMSNAVVIKANNFEAAFGAFSGDARFKTLATPSLITNHAQSATLLGGTSFPVVTTTKEGERVTESTEYKDIGTSIKILPQVVGDTVTLSVDMSLSDVSATALGATSAPTLIKRSLTSQVTLSSGSVAVVGGLVSERQTQSSSGLFFFNSLNKDAVSMKSELVLVLYVDILSEERICSPADGAAAP